MSRPAVHQQRGHGKRWEGSVAGAPRPPWHDVGMIRFLVRLAITAVAIWAAASWLSGIVVDTNGHGGWASVGIYLLVALVFTLINTYIKPLVMLLSLPLLILTLGLFYLVVNALMLLLTSWVTTQLGWGLSVDGFWTAVGGAIVIAIVNWVLSALVPDQFDGQRH